MLALTLASLALGRGASLQCRGGTWCVSHLGETGSLAVGYAGPLEPGRKPQGITQASAPTPSQRSYALPVASTVALGSKTSMMRIQLTIYVMG